MRQKMSILLKLWRKFINQKVLTYDKYPLLFPPLLGLALLGFDNNWTRNPGLWNKLVFYELSNLPFKIRQSLTNNTLFVKKQHCCIKRRLSLYTFQQNLYFATASFGQLSSLHCSQKITLSFNIRITNTKQNYCWQAHMLIGEMHNVYLWDRIWRTNFQTQIECTKWQIF